MKQIIKANISGRKVLAFFLAANSIYAVMVCLTVPRLLNYSGGMMIFDGMSFGYSAEYANSLLRALGDEGRAAYLFQQLPVDMIYPALFGISYCLTTAYFLNKLGAIDSRYFYLCFFPLMTCVFDYLENTASVLMLVNFPANSDFLISTASVFTQIKSACGVLTLLTLLVLVFYYAGERLLKRRTAG